MTEEVVKVCKHHGPLLASQANFYLEKGSPRFRCKACLADSHRKHYERHKETVLAHQKAYRKEFPDRIRHIKYRSWLKHKHKHVEKHRANRARYDARHRELERLRDRTRKRRYCQELTEAYVREKMRKSSKLSAKDIPLCVVQCQRALLLLKRAIKNRKNKND